GVQDDAAGMHVEAFHTQSVSGNNAFHMSQLVHADTELAIDMAGADALVATCENVRVDADADRYPTTLHMAATLMYGYAVNVDMDTQFNCFFIFRQGYHVGRKEDLIRQKACPQSDHRLLNAHHVQAEAQLPHLLEHGQIGQRFAGIHETRGCGCESCFEPL